MFQRFLFPDNLVRRGFFPHFRLRDFLDQLDVVGRAHVEFAGSTLLLRTSSQDELTGDELVLRACDSGPTPPIIVNTLRQHDGCRQPYGRFDADIRELLRFAQGGPSDVPFELNFTVSCAALGLQPNDVIRRLIDRMTDLHAKVGIMQVVPDAAFDPQQPHALVSVNSSMLARMHNPKPEHVQLGVLCRGGTPAALLASWNAVINRLRPQFRESTWNASMLFTLLIDIGKGGCTAQACEGNSGFTIPWCPPEWLDLPTRGEIVEQQRSPHQLEVPTQHHWSSAAPTWLNGRTFRLQKGRGQLVAEWA